MPIARPLAEAVRTLPYAPIYLHSETDSPQTFTISWVSDDAVDQFPIPGPVVVALWINGEEGEEIPATITNNTISVDVPGLPQGKSSLAVWIKGDRLFATAEITVDTPNPDLPIPNWRPYEVTGPAYYPGWWDESAQWNATAGPTGPTGPEGPAGAPGSSVTVYQQATVPVGAVPGDVWVVTP